jgi:hypothetical protein
VQDELDSYLMGIKDGIMQQYEVESEDALDFVFEKADSLAAQGSLPPLPDDDSDEAAVVEWLAAARSIGFAAFVMEQADAEAQAGDNEEPGENGENGENGEGEDEDQEQYESLISFLQKEGYQISESVEPKQLFAQISQTPELQWLTQDEDFKRLQAKA